jgi:hypothetical protein
MIKKARRLKGHTQGPNMIKRAMPLMVMQRSYNDDPCAASPRRTLKK